ncbi:LytR/AlgR family response regulator transcription factor [Aureispira anguillae]|uniref:LytTR family DNA-binding domain-containing protein n=1 Tax=Aureispira anguillae TaxID=2864201 RepID=A0A915YCS6_9BACT|nr:response regulator [Aureispira anguillae]BDS10695.1 LytTR family DNA-binding domain-containing protein [Aureispira anguillae]
MINAIIVDDERSARNILQKLLDMNHPEIHVLDTCPDLLTAVQSIKKHQPDVVFLDVEMPRNSGFEITNYFNPINFEIIFITAYDQYAIKAFEISALDYILKPIEVDRLESCIKKLSKNIEIADLTDRLKVLTETIESQKVSKITVYYKGSRYIIEVSNIIAVKAEHAYCTIYISGSNDLFVISKNLKQVTHLIDDNKQFYRTHRSWLINLNKMQSYSKSKGIVTLEGSIEARLSKYKFEDFEKFIMNR